MTFHTPEWVEDFARDYLEAQVAKKVDATIDNLAPPQGDDAVSRYAADLFRKNEAKIEEYKSLLKPGAVEGIAGVNLPMLIRALTYRNQNLATVVAKAISGGSAGVVHMTQDCCSKAMEPGGGAR